MGNINRVLIVWFAMGAALLSSCDDNSSSACARGQLRDVDTNSCYAPIAYAQQPTLVAGSIAPSEVRITLRPSQNATLYWIVYEDNIDEPTAAQLVADATDGSAGVARSGKTGVEIIGTFTIHITGLDDAMHYDVYTVLVPAVGDPLLSHKVDIETTVGRPVFVQQPEQSDIKQDSVEVDFTVSGGTKLYWVLYENELSNPTASHIINDATNTNGATDRKGVLTAAVNQKHTISIPRLSTRSSYYFYVVAEDEDGHQTFPTALPVATSGDRYVCLHGSPVDSEIMPGENAIKCATCDDYYRLTADEQCVKTNYYCDDGVVASSSPQVDGHLTTNADVEACRGTPHVGKDIELFAFRNAVVPHGLWGNDDHIWTVDYLSRTLIPSHKTTGVPDSSNRILLNSNNTEPHGIWGDGTTIWVADWRQKKLFAYTIATGAHDSNNDIALDTANDNPRGVWGAGTTIWVVDRTDNKLYSYNKDTGDRLSKADIDLSAANVEPRGAWGDETTLWIADWDKERLFAYSKSTEGYDYTPDKDIPLVGSNTSPRGVWGDNTTLWVADRQDRILYAYGKSSKKYSPHQNISFNKNNNPRDVWSDGTTLWVTELDSDSLVVYAYDIASGQYSTKEQFFLSVHNQHPGPIWGDGTTIWVLDHSDRRIYAYDQLTKQRQTSKDILMYWRNKSAQSMWGDGSTLWVADRTNDKDYGYALYGYHIVNRTPNFRTFIRLSSDNRHPRGVWGDGTTIWVGDNVDDKLYAYTIATKKTDSNKDIDLSQQNNDSYGMWGNGHALWILDGYDNRIYRYHW